MNYPEFTNLMEIMEKLRSPKGCAWDAEQTHESLIKYLREESFEVIEAILHKDDKHLCEELGDLILQVVFHAIIAKERSAFSINDILKAINEKLIVRHPHVFDSDHVTITTLEEQWDNIKKSQKKHAVQKTCMEQIPETMEPWLKAERIQLEASKHNFDWGSASGIMDKIQEECLELKHELEINNSEAIQEEIGDLLFSVINLCRFLKFNPSKLVEKSNKKFTERYDKMLEIASKENTNTKFKHLSLDEKEKYWQNAKILLKERKL